MFFLTLKWVIRDIPEFQWLRFWVPNVGGPGLVPDQDTRSHMPQVSVSMLQSKIPRDAVKSEDLVYCN